MLEVINLKIVNKKDIFRRYKFKNKEALKYKINKIKKLLELLGEKSCVETEKYLIFPHEHN